MNFRINKCKSEKKYAEKNGIALFWNNKHKSIITYKYLVKLIIIYNNIFVYKKYVCIKSIAIMLTLTCFGVTIHFQILSWRWDWWWGRRYGTTFAIVMMTIAIAIGDQILSRFIVSTKWNVAFHVILGRSHCTFGFTE